MSVRHLRDQLFLQLLHTLFIATISTHTWLSFQVHFTQRNTVLFTSGVLPYQCSKDFSGRSWGYANMPFYQLGSISLRSKNAESNQTDRVSNGVSNPSGRTPTRSLHRHKASSFCSRSPSCKLRICTDGIQIRRSPVVTGTCQQFSRVLFSFLHIKYFC